MHASYDVPTRSKLGPTQNFLARDYNEIVEKSEVTDKVKSITGATIAGANVAKDTTKDIFQHLGTILESLAEKATSNKTATAVIAALGALYAGILSLKNVVNTFEKFTNPKADPEISWVVYGLQSILQGGLAFGLAAPFLGVRSFFTQTINGRNVVQMKMIMGSVLAPFILATGMKVAHGVSILNRIPFIGPPLGDIFQKVSKATREVTISPESSVANQHMNPGVPNLAGMPA